MKGKLRRRRGNKKQKKGKRERERERERGREREGGREREKERERDISWGRNIFSLINSIHCKPTSVNNSSKTEF